VCEAGRVYLLRDRAQVGTPSHPGRVLLRVRWQGLVFAVGAPPRCEPRTKRAGRFGFVVGAPPPVRTANEASTDQRPGQAPIRTRGGCSYMTIHIRRVSYMWRVL